MNHLRIPEALDNIWELVSRTNKYIDETTPWILAKDEGKRNRLGTVIYNLSESLRIISVCLSAFLPETSEKYISSLMWRSHLGTAQLLLMELAQN